jgi:fibronectin type 3 domain-containing protein
VTSGAGYATVQSGSSSTSFTDTGVTSGTAYYYIVSAVDPAGEGTNSPETAATPTGGAAPSAPAGLTATALQTKQVPLSWNSVTGATSYSVYRGTASGAEASTPVKTGLTSASYTDTGLSDGSAYFYQVTATNGNGEGARSTEATATTNAAPTVATVAGATPATVTGTTTGLSVLGADDGGESNLTYTWAATAKPAGSNPVFSANGTNAAKASTVTFDRAGAYTFTVTITDAGGLSVTSSVNVTVNQALTSIVVTPASATVNVSVTQQYTAVGNDQFGIALTSQLHWTWTVGGGGTISTSGVFTAGTTAGGPYQVKAAFGSFQGLASVTVQGVNAAPTVAIAAAASPATVTGTTTGLSVLGADDGGESNLTYTWATTGTPPGQVTFSGNGDNTAKNTTVTFAAPGSYTFQVTIADPAGLNVTSSVNVTVSSTNSIVLTPSTAQVPLNSAQWFTAYETDQFGNALATQPTFTWSVNGAGSIGSSIGIYSSGATTGSATVQATDGTYTGMASVTVTHSAPSVVVAASANPGTVGVGGTATLNVLGGSDMGEGTLTYTWATTGTPPAPVTFSGNGSSTAKVVTTTFTAAGTYNLQVTITDTTGLSVTTPVSVTVIPVVAPASVSAIPGDGVVLVTWSPVAVATGYTVYQVSGGVYTPVATLDAGKTALADTTVNNGSGYSYAVTVTCGTTNSAYSTATASVTPSVQPGAWTIVYTPGVSTTSASPSVAPVTASASSSGGKLFAKAQISGFASGFTAHAEAARGGTWTATWHPSGSGAWPTLLLLTHDQMSIYTASVAGATGTASVTSVGGAIAISAAFPIVDVPADSGMGCAESWNIADPACLVWTLNRTQDSANQVSADDGTMIGWTHFLSQHITDTLFYTQAYLQTHYASPSAIVITVPSGAIDVTSSVAVTSSTDAAGNANALATSTDTVTGR